MSNFKKKLEEIAREELDIETLEQRKSDSLDFHEVSVWGVERALKRAYTEGVQSVASKMVESSKSAREYNKKAK